MNTKPTTQQVINALKGKKFNEAKSIIETKFNGKKVPMGCDAIARYEVEGVNFYTVNFFNYDRMGRDMPPPTFNFN
jgi:hypothetical protein